MEIRMILNSQDDIPSQERNKEKQSGIGLEDVHSIDYFPHGVATSTITIHIVLI
jgi:hypothetical protein